MQEIRVTARYYRGMREGKRERGVQKQDVFSEVIICRWFEITSENQLRLQSK